MTELSPLILDFEHVTLWFGGVVAIDDLSFTARRGEITSIIGPNGAGKTTVFNCLTGFYRPPVGRMRFTRSDGKVLLLERMEDFRIADQARIIRTFQNVRLFENMSVLENLLVGQHSELKKASGFGLASLFGTPRHRAAMKTSIEIARYWLDRMDLADVADVPAGTLPYGAQRRLEIARAMCASPQLLCLDEPAAGLNPFESRDMMLLLADLRNEHGVSILLVEHDMSVVMQVSDSIVVLDQGRLVREGTPSEVRNDPEVIRAYLGAPREDGARRAGAA